MALETAKMEKGVGCSEADAALGGNLQGVSLEVKNLNRGKILVRLSMSEWNRR